MEEGQRLDLIVGHAILFPRRRVRPETIFAPVDERSLQIGQLLVLPLHGSVFDDGGVEGQKIREGFGNSRHGAKERRHFAEPMGQLVENGMNFGRRVFLRNRADSRACFGCCGHD